MNLLNKEKILEQAKVFADEGKTERAILEYEKVLEADPQDLRVKARIAELYVKCKKPAEAIKLFQEVAANYTSDGFYLKAITVYKNILRLNPSLMEVNQRLAELYEKMELKEDALRQYDILANSSERRGENERVAEIRERMVRLDPKSYAARVKLAELYQMRGETDKALDQYEEMVVLLGNKPEEERKRVDLYERILHHRPDRLIMFRELVKLYYQQGEKKKALKWLEQKKDITPFDPELLRMQAECYAELNQLEPARQCYLALADLFAEQGAVDQALLSLGEIVLLLPEEEQNVAEQAEKLRAGSFAQLKIWIEQRRAELALRSQQEEAQQSAKQAHERSSQEIKEQEEQAKLAAERRSKMREVQEKLGVKVPEQSLPPLDPPPPQASARQVPPPPVSLRASAKQSPESAGDRHVSAIMKADPRDDKQTKLPSAADIRAIESALSLVAAYMRMGLTDEAKKEWQHADGLIGKFAAGQIPQHLIERLSELKKQLFPEVAKEVAAPKVNIAVPPPSPAATPAKASRPPVPPAEPVQSKDPKKRKVSFV